MNGETQKGTEKKAVPRNCTEELLEELYKNVGMGTDSLLNVIPKVKNTELSAELTSQLDKYGGYSEQIGNMLEQCGGEAKEKNIMAKMSAKLGVEMSTLTDPTDAHIAQMVIEGTTMGITDTIRLVRGYENSNCTEGALSLARSVVSYQEQAVEKMKSFL